MSEKFNVIIPFKAYSCATLIALGADEILMTKLGQLSPIDPSLEHPLGPHITLPGQAPQIMKISVEDVNAFFQLAKESELKSEDSMKLVFQILASSVNPLALGAVQRSREQIAFLAKELMSHHIHDKERIEKIVNILTRQRFSHDYIIGRTEATKALNLNIIDPDPKTTAIINELFNAYNNILLLDTPYHPEGVLGTIDMVEASLKKKVGWKILQFKKRNSKGAIMTYIDYNDSSTAGYSKSSAAMVDTTSDQIFSPMVGGTSTRPMPILIIQPKWVNGENQIQKGSFTFDWAGGLSELQGSINSVELAHEALKCDKCISLIQIFF